MYIYHVHCACAQERESADEEVPTACGCIGSDFDYLVGMPLWSLTTEKVIVTRATTTLAVFGHKYTSEALCLFSPVCRVPEDDYL